MMSEARTVLLVWVVAALASGCFDQVGCPDCLVTIHVRARDGGPVENASVSDGGAIPFRCEVSAGETTCSARPFYGTLMLVIEAPSYQSAELAVEVPDPESFANCECSVDRSVVLEPF